MELKEFIGQALADIVQGVLDAQQTLGANGKYINPELSTTTFDIKGRALARPT